MTRRYTRHPMILPIHPSPDDPAAPSLPDDPAAAEGLGGGAEVRYEPVAYCDECAEQAGMDDDPEEWAETHNKEYHS